MKKVKINSYEYFDDSVYKDACKDKVVKPTPYPYKWNPEKKSYLTQIGSSLNNEELQEIIASFRTEFLYYKPMSPPKPKKKKIG